MATRLIVAATVVALLAGSAALAQSPPASIMSELKNNTGQTVGMVTLTEAPKGVLLRVEARGLSPGWHGMHFHEKGDCSKADFTSAGGHTHGAADRVHGLLNPAGNENGDLPNIRADANGVATAEVFTSLTTLATLRDADGSAVVIHANPDDYMAQPIGGAGARVACAVIK
jgi:Cu-Zn family superoxide dismutase